MSRAFIGPLVVCALALAACNSQLGTFGGEGGGGGGGDSGSLDDYQGSNITSANLLASPFGLAFFQNETNPTAIFVSLSQAGTGAQERRRILSFPPGTNNPIFTVAYENHAPPAGGEFNIEDLRSPMGIAYDNGSGLLFIADRTPHDTLQNCSGEISDTPVMSARVAAFNAPSAGANALGYNCSVTERINDAIADSEAALNAAISGQGGSFTLAAFQPTHVLTASVGATRGVFIADSGNDVVLGATIPTGVGASIVRVLAFKVQGAGQMVYNTNSPGTLYAAAEDLNDVVVVSNPAAVFSGAAAVDGSDEANRVIDPDALDDDRVEPDSPRAIRFFGGSTTQLLAMNAGGTDVLDLIDIGSGGGFGRQIDDLKLTELSGLSTGMFSSIGEMLAPATGASPSEIYIANKAAAGNIVRLSK